MSTTQGPQTVRTIVLKNDAVEVVLAVDREERVLLQDIFPARESAKPHVSKWYGASMLPLAAVRLAGEGNLDFKTSKSMAGSHVSERLRYKSHRERTEQPIRGKRQVKVLDVEQYDPKTKVTVTSHLSIFEGLPVLRSSTSICNSRTEGDMVVTQLASLVVGDMTRANEWWHEYVLSIAHNSWLREAQWKDLSLPSIGVDNYGVHETAPEHVASLGSFSVSNRGTFSTQGHLPMGVLKRRNGSETWLWQVENNGSWRWEIGDYKDNVYLVASGPNESDHDWRQRLAPGESFTSAPAAIVHVYGDADAAFAALTEYRRAIIRPHPDNDKVPIIFNDYMNCLMGDPTDEKILALIDPVAGSGAEYFVIDAGWYADDTSWWDEVGLWEPSKTRFPMGLGKLLDRIREKGLKPGLWVEPEVIGVRSVMAQRLPEEAFFHRGSERVLEKNRYHLDYRHPAVIERMNSVIDGLVRDFAVDYFKFDYNIEVLQGTDIDASSAGSGQLGHNRAYLQWVTGLLDRHPGLVIENCSSGAQRMDYAMLAVHSVQSTSDQMDPVRYASIAAAIHTAVLPEQGATWAYPQPGWSDETNALTVVNALLGRVHLSGRLDILSPEQLKLVYHGMDVHREIKGVLNTALPFWPLGLPGWHDEWLAQGLKAADGTCFVAVWRRGGSGTGVFPIRPLKGHQSVEVKLLYPATFQAEATWGAEQSVLKVTLPSDTVCARLFSLRALKDL